MGQQPNIELEMADLPRPVPVRGPEKRWRPERPGDLAGPDAMPWGGAFGTTGPDSGYAMVLVRRRELDLAPGEHRHNAEVAVAILAAARASAYGRAPVAADVDAAAVLLGYDVDGVPGDTAAGLAADRTDRLANLGHDAVKVQQLIAAVPRDVLMSSPDELRRRLAAGEGLVAR